jgi:hypothetical protein
MKYNQNAIYKIQEARNIEELLEIWDKMCENCFLNYDVEIDTFNENKDDFKKLE